LVLGGKLVPKLGTSQEGKIMTTPMPTTTYVPESFQIPEGEDIKSLKEKVLAKFETFRKNTRVVIPDDVADRFEYIEMAKKYWEEQSDLAKIDMRERMGDHSHAVRADGRPVAKRLRFFKATYAVDGHFEDQIRRA
jgi:hypothetical protein